MASKENRCYHCSGALTITWMGPISCINCGREPDHYQSGPSTCKKCRPKPVNYEITLASEDY